MKNFLPTTARRAKAARKAATAGDAVAEADVTADDASASASPHSKAVVVPGAIGMALLMAALWASNLYVIAGLFGISTFAYAALSTMANTFPADLFPSESVATVSGMSGTGAGIGTILSTYLIGYVSDHYSFGPVLIGASLVPLLAMALVLLLVRNTAESGQGRVRRI